MQLEPSQIVFISEIKKQIKAGARPLSKGRKMERVSN